ncbi:MAG: helix-turn-helix transcriptional regulator [Microcoleus sp. PH2017_20_SFW_D_A]|nr:helix-turn-helix transcriptional regulator [Microcoleus sp. PH2017_19_SFW_U_A]MCC3523954.1 helix-turn-helix transcriptional regulator [Microcoleus sp. PH2017_20_SFW_D_A]MCC3554964.1 helix-turn-helix transcriptional regulator [Microcoleus sp. PH2017_35_SFW_U_B]MCC3564501.1 helix-turn-helix transcriptional regulator [Microcoleus sp. PH2017_31_RDM_U_A]MCC3577938.1 helix-turn-helix transcriptional regulator [Microcoleus sp. PH2017_32_RDM_D_A]MCC3615647.1 helix-turn-helix transcriptional regulat
MTQEQAARALGIRPATLSSWETGRTPRMAPSLIKKMMQIYDCSLDDLIEAFESKASVDS